MKKNKAQLLRLNDKFYIGDTVFFTMSNGIKKGCILSKQYQSYRVMYKTVLNKKRTIILKDKQLFGGVYEKRRA